MQVAKWASSLLLSAFATSAAFGGAEYDFVYTADGGNIPDFGTETEGVSLFSLMMDEQADPGILTLELVLNGLTHTAPWDLDIYLIDPFGNSLAIMTDRGDMHGVTNIDLTFSDAGSPLPLDPDTALDTLTAPQQAEGGSLNDTFNFRGMDEWTLVIVDDSEGNQGFLNSFTLRGTVVPEPVTLSLLAIGALTTLRRRR